MNSNLDTLREKIQTLSPKQLAKVEDFVEFLRSRGEDRDLIHSAAALSSPVFGAVWNNSEDDVYETPPSIES